MLLSTNNIHFISDLHVSKPDALFFFSFVFLCKHQGPFDFAHFLIPGIHQPRLVNTVRKCLCKQQQPC